MSLVGDSDSADNESCDSPPEGTSPQFVYSDKLAGRRLQKVGDVAHPLHTRDGMLSSVAPGLTRNLVVQDPSGMAGKLSPSQSEPDLANALRRRSQRRVPTEFAASSSLERTLEDQHEQPLPTMEGVHSFPSSPEYPHTRFANFQRVGSEEGSVSSSPEHPVFRGRAPSMLSGSRRHAGEDINASRYFLTSHSHGELRRTTKRSVAPEISDNVVRAVRAMNEALKQERSRSKEHEPRRVLSSDSLSSTAQQESGEVSRRSADLCLADGEVKQGNDLDVLRFSKLGLNPGPSSGSTHQESRLSLQSSQELALGGHSLFDTEGGVVSWGLMMQSPSLPSQPLMPFAEWSIEFSELRIGIRVGIGSFGEVFRGIWRGTEVAIKVMLEQDLTTENMQDFCNEISLLSRLRHPNVILFLGACIKPPHLSMVTEYMHMGSLYRLIHTSGQGKKFSWRRRLKMLRDICRGMMCVQRMKIVHLDLKSANCLVDKHWAVKICDFGLSRIVTGSTVSNYAAVGTPEWTAPELLRNEPVSEKCDVFSLGVIIWELSTLKRPWEGLQPAQVALAVAQHRARLEIPEGIIGRLIADCWEENPASRPSYEEILTRLHECEFLQS
ncbi:unnamed protein product [Sphagnum jensenii]|uniref:Protein kinase domain-containing protein n=1 Tax=Sphagnum jensenii TaxID=128206 RepID=A0ABP0WKT7_9BRYO